MNNINLLRKLNLSSTNKIILESVRKYCRIDLIKENEKDIIDHRKIYKSMGTNGLLGPTLKTNGCLGLDYKMYGLIAKEIEYIDSSLRSMYSVQSSLVMNPINKYGNDYLKTKYLDDLASGDKIGCFGLTEPDGGSDATNMKTEAVLERDHYILNGNKTWITNSPIADILLVWAKYDKNIHGFILDRNTPGLETPEILGKESLKNSKTGMIFLKDVKVPKENKLDIVGMKGPLSCLNDARLGISFGVLGAADFCINTSLEYSLNRKLFGSLLAEKQLFQQKIVNMITEYNLGLLAAIEVAEMVDNNDSIPEMISMIKRNNCEKALNIARTSRDILGGNGITREYNVFKHLVNLETVYTYEGTHDIHTLILGKYFTGYSSF